MQDRKWATMVVSVACGLAGLVGCFGLLHLGFAIWDCLIGFPDESQMHFIAAMWGCLSASALLFMAAILDRKK